MKQYKLRELFLIEVTLKHNNHLIATNNITKYFEGAEKVFQDDLVGIKKKGMIRTFYYEDD